MHEFKKGGDEQRFIAPFGAMEDPHARQSLALYPGFIPASTMAFWDSLFSGAGSAAFEGWKDIWLHPG